MQNLYNLIYREEEREMIPYCIDSGIASIPYSPLIMGEFTSKNKKTARTDAGVLLITIWSGVKQDSNEIILDRMEELAKKHDKAMVQIAMAWFCTKKFITSPIVGISKIEQLYDIMRSFKIKLTDDEVKYIEEPCTPRPIFRHQ
jgi:aryl-alcohol dehydrogenase-like predicted oxidoreductase